MMVVLQLLPKKGELIGFALETDTNESQKLVEVALRLINNP